MSISTFFNSYAGMYVAQTFCHSVIASVITDQALRAWNISDPAVRQRFRLIVVLVPIFLFPFYQLLNHDRSSVQFRLGAMFDVNRWLNMEIWGVVPVGVLFLVILAITTLIFVFQEMIPIFIHTLESRNAEHEGTTEAPDQFVENASRAMSMPPPAVLTVDEDEFLIFSTTGKNPVIVVSSGLVEALTPDQMQAALAHEIAHIARSRRPMLLAVFFLRMIMFFNPVSLVEFRRVVRNEEKICDDIAVSLTHRPEVLAEALKKFCYTRETPETGDGRKPLFTPVNLEEYSHSMQLEGRITRLAENRPRNSGSRWLPFILTILIIVGLNYFVV